MIGVRITSQFNVRDWYDTDGSEQSKPTIFRLGRTSSRR